MAPGTATVRARVRIVVSERGRDRGHSRPAATELSLLRLSPAARAREHRATRSARSALASRATCRPPPQRPDPGRQPHPQALPPSLPRSTSCPSLRNRTDHALAGERAHAPPDHRVAARYRGPSRSTDTPPRSTQTATPANTTTRTTSTKVVSRGGCGRRPRDVQNFRTSKRAR